MPYIDDRARLQKDIILQSMDNEYSYVRSHYKELAQYIIPQRYHSLDEGKRTRNKDRNKYILDGHGTMAARTLASGMFYGATNPTHRWLKLSTGDNSVIGQRYTDAVVDFALGAIADSNIYTSLPVTYLDMGVFGTTAMLIYEDPETLFRSYLLPAGEYRVMKDARGKVSYLGRKFRMTADQMVNRFGEENVSQQVRRAYSEPTNDKFQEFEVRHLIEPNIPMTLPPHFAYRECYWDPADEKTVLLGEAGFYEKPFIAPRWELVGNATYGVSPGMDALPDIISLQHLTRNKAVGLDKMVKPPMVVDQALRNQPTALMPNGITYVPSASSVGAKPAYELRIPFGELNQDKQELKYSIGRFFYNDLFRAILDLSTVRSATEIVEAAAEKLVLLGPVVNRTEDEALSDMVVRILGIMRRNDRLPPSPLLPADRVRIEYDSILSAAQKAAGINNIERFMGAVGELAPVAPETLHVINANELVREYGDRLNVPAAILRTRGEVEQLTAQQQQLAEAERQAAIGKDLAQAAGALTEAPVQ